MANNVKISLLGLNNNIVYNGSKDYDKLVDRMIVFLSGHLDNVLPNNPDIILLPECCDRYSAMPHDERIPYYECRGDRIRDFLCDVARKNNTNIAYSAVRNTPWDEKRPFRNSTQIIGRDGNIVGIYDKNHLVTSEYTKSGIAYGKEAKTIKTDFGDVACAICFDLNFEELMKKYVPQKPDLIAFCSQYHGGLAQDIWAYKCRSYFAGCVFNDQCRIINPYGETVASSTNYYHFVTGTVNLDYTMAHIDYNNAKFSAAKKKYGDALTIHDPGHVGSVLLTCEDPDMCIYDIVKEFEIELLDDYMVRSLKERSDNLEY